MCQTPCFDQQTAGIDLLYLPQWVHRYLTICGKYICEGDTTTMPLLLTEILQKGKLIGCAHRYTGKVVILSIYEVHAKDFTWHSGYPQRSSCRAPTAPGTGIYTPRCSGRVQSDVTVLCHHSPGWMLGVNALNYSTGSWEGFWMLASAHVLYLTTFYPCLSISSVFWMF